MDLNSYTRVHSFKPCFCLKLSVLSRGLSPSPSRMQPGSENKHKGGNTCQAVQGWLHCQGRLSYHLWLAMVVARIVCVCVFPKRVSASALFEKPCRNPSARSSYNASPPRHGNDESTLRSLSDYSHICISRKELPFVYHCSDGDVETMT